MPNHSSEPDSTRTDTCGVVKNLPFALLPAKPARVPSQSYLDESVFGCRPWVVSRDGHLAASEEVREVAYISRHRDPRSACFMGFMAEGLMRKYVCFRGEIPG